MKLKKERLSAINELIEMTKDSRAINNLFIPYIESVMDMIEKNIFRPLPSLTNMAVCVSETGVEEEEQTFDPSWLHLHGIYELLLQLILSEHCDSKIFKPFITPDFMSEFLQLFDSNVSEEREVLKNILHKLYAKLVPRRKMIRKAITDLFHLLIHEIHKFNGTNELLDIMASIISGFAVPLREEHVIFFKNIIIPLYKVQTASLYIENLMKCTSLFLMKDNSLTIPLLEGLLRYWPFANGAKELAFLAELIEVFDYSDVDKLERLIGKLFRRIARCISGNHLQVADRAMCLFENDHMIQIIQHYKKITYGILVPAILYILENHWNVMIKEGLRGLREILERIDKDAYNAALENLSKQKYDKTLRIAQPIDERNKMDQKWKCLAKVAIKNNPSFIEPVLPFSDCFIPSEYNLVYRMVYNKEKYINE